MSSWLLNLLILKSKTTGRLVIFLVLAAFFVAPKMVFAQVIINEIMYDLKTGTDDGHEWIELYNDGSSDIDLTGGKINDGDNDTNHGFNTTTAKTPSRGSLIIAASSFLILADDATKIASDLPDYQGNIIDTVFDLKNTSGQLKIFNKDNLELASLSYNKDMDAAGNGRTLEWDGAALKESTVDGGTPGRVNSVLNSSDATPSAAPSASPTTTTTTTPSPSTATQSFDYSKDILINEFLPAPNAGEKEWVELFNAGSSVINLVGWQIDDDDNSTSPQIIPENTTIYANGFLVISFNKSTLNNEGDKVRLLWPDNQVVHAVSYDKAKQGQSVAKFGTSWLWTNQPTPGSANKKSAVENSEPAVIVTTAEKINPIEESVSAPISPSPNKKTPTPQTIANPASISSVDDQPTDQLENINLSAAINDPIQKEESTASSTLVLFGIIILSALAACGLIYFKRKVAIHD